MTLRKLAFLLVPLTSAAAAADYRGAPIEAVLEGLRAGGLEVLYSSDLVKPWMRVEQEPARRRPARSWPRSWRPTASPSPTGPAIR